MTFTPLLIQALDSPGLPASSDHREPLIIFLYPLRVLNFQKSLSPVSLIQYWCANLPPANFQLLTVAGASLQVRSPGTCFMQKSWCSRCVNAPGFCNHTHYVPTLIGVLQGIPHVDGNIGFDSPKKDKRGYYAHSHHVLHGGLLHPKWLCKPQARKDR